MDSNRREAPELPTEKMLEGLRAMAEATDEERSNNPRIKRYHDLPAYPLDAVRDGSDSYFKTLTEAILAAAAGDYGSINYKGYKIYYMDTPSLKSLSLEDGHKEYSYEIRFMCDALCRFGIAEYHSEEERKAFLDPESEQFKMTLALLDRQIEYLDEGTWIKGRKKLKRYELKDYSPGDIHFADIEWADRTADAEATYGFLLEDAMTRAKGCPYTEEDFDIFAAMIRKMVFFTDYGKRNSLCRLQGLVWEWKPETKREKYILRCMKEFGQGDLPDRLLDNCTIYYLVDDPQGWEAAAYLIPIIVLKEICQDQDLNPDRVKDEMLRIFDLVPDGSRYRERMEKLIEEDRAKAGKGENGDDQEGI